MYLLHTMKNADNILIYPFAFAYVLSLLEFLFYPLHYILSKNEKIDLKAIQWHEKYTFRAIFLLNRNNKIFIYIRGKL